LTISVGLFSTLSGPGSLALVEAIADACAKGAVGDAAVGFLFVNRETGEAAETDAAIEKIQSAYDFALVRRSAARFERQARLVARAAADKGDDEPLWTWRERFYETYRAELPATQLDLLLGDLWVWSRPQCAERRGVNLHPALPGASIGKLWYEVIWDLVETDATESGVMLHRVTPEVDMGPVVSYCRYSIRTPELEALWSTLPVGPERAALIAEERSRRRDSDHPLFRALRAAGLRREVPLMLATVGAFADKRIRLTDAGVVDGRGELVAGGTDLSTEVEHRARLTPV
jgi:folate-dependent phosphoribosylglycinamide formyltransferase PurN